MKSISDEDADIALLGPAAGGASALEVGGSVASRKARSSTPDVDGFEVTDDLPRPRPICTGELEVIEAYLGSFLDELLGGSAPRRRTSKRHNLLASKHRPKPDTE